MVIVDVVLETYDAVDFTAWPIAEPSSDRLLALSGQMSPAEVGTAMAVIFSYNRLPVEPVASLTQAHLEQHLAEAEALIAPGGLRFRDTGTGVEVAPGCCFGLENWRDWWDVPLGQETWLGHAPTTQLEHQGQTIRLRQGHQDDTPVHAIEFAFGELQRLLISAQQQLSGFLELVQRWATNIAPGLTDSLITVLDEHLRINEPLPS
ncbi:hypothetical protein ACBJ59_54615 [Nonomuraea sp. MTCD27]|uniref:hypothetical protein n=1 Tax=Nonomuraea sp. MTCD27 TaxID=1676747 RepID=UPI0035C1F50E